ncbi:hypothetical protein BGZ65_002233 [Modicella reniformis]|uniref:Uncharacterized protein n=1 Tax=Modicella reniformis TaxID=1440133 RepID=A0A9P6J1E2_9FUNG|nr:hypothetical protein BGZ65_002233 [Modicella reniformis]
MEQSDNDMKVEAVLDHNVATELMDYSIYEFRELVRTDEPGAKRAVGRIRTRLSEVESVECLFSGLRGHIPVVRALKVLTKKRK